MKFFNFHLMPYAEADLDSLKRHGTSWLTYPNRNYDPEVGSRLYHRFLDELEYAAELGFDGVCVNEHHQSAYGMMPIPGIFAGVLARSVKKAKIAVLGRALPLLN
ncbi:MAG TPA: flavin-dependent oxidoreductase, partial [Alphaproteobacteria bacterium]